MTKVWVRKELMHLVMRKEVLIQWSWLMPRACHSVGC